jgi:hypothetical protein
LWTTTPDKSLQLSTHFYYALWHSTPQRPRPLSRTDSPDYSGFLRFGSWSGIRSGHTGPSDHFIRMYGGNPLPTLGASNDKQHTSNYEYDRPTDKNTLGGRCPLPVTRVILKMYLNEGSGLRVRSTTKEGYVMRRIWLVLAMAVAIAAVLGSVGMASAQDTTTGDTTTQATKFTLTDVHPNGGDSSVGPDTKVTATFNKDLRASTINDTSNNFRLKDLTTGNFVGADITVKDGVAVLNPNHRLKSGHLYKAIIDAGSDGVRSQSGDTLQRVTANNVHFSGGSASWKFRVR